MATELYEPPTGKCYVGVLADADANYNSFLSLTNSGGVAWDGWFDDASNNDVAVNDAWKRVVARGNNIVWSWRILRGPYSETLTAKASCRSCAQGYLDQNILNDLATFRGQLALGKALIVRPFHEFSGNWGTTGYGFQMFSRITDPVTKKVISTPYRPHNSAADFIGAWRRLKIMADGGTRTAVNAALAAVGLPALTDGGTADLPKTNIAFHWCPNRAVNPGDARNFPALRYPGDEYVNWVGTDAYSIFKVSEVWTNQLGKQDGPDWIYNTYSAPGTAEKPFMWTELGTRGTDDASWHTYLFDWCEARPRVKGVLYFNQSAGDGNSLLKDHPNVANVWKTRITNARYIKTKSGVVAGEEDDGGTPGTTTPPTTITDVEITSSAYQEDTDTTASATVNTEDADAVLVLVGFRSATAAVDTITGDSADIAPYIVGSAAQNTSDNSSTMKVAGYLVPNVTQKASWVATLTLTGSAPCFIAAYGLANVPDTEPSRSSTVSAAITTNPSVTLSSLPGDMAFSICSMNSNPTVTFSHSKLYDTQDAPNTYGTSGKVVVQNQPATGSSITMSHTLGTERAAAMLGVVVKAPTNAPPSPPTITATSPDSGVIRAIVYTPADTDVNGYLVRWKSGEYQTFADQTAGAEFAPEATAVPFGQYTPADVSGFTPASTITLGAFSRDTAGNYSIARTINVLVSGTGATSTSGLLVAELEALVEELEDAYETSKTGTRDDMDLAANRLSVARRALREARRAYEYSVRYEEADS